MSQQICFSFSW